MKQILLALIFSAPGAALAQSEPHAFANGDYHSPGYHTQGYHTQSYHDRVWEAPSERQEAWKHDADETPNHDEESRLPSASNRLDDR